MTVDMLIQENCDIAREEGMAKGIAKGMARGLAEGRAEGKAEGRAEAEAHAKAEKATMIKDLYSKNVSIQTIAECGHLTEAEVKAIISAK